MRISDWSSDVCSSDLGAAGWPPVPAALRRAGSRWRRVRSLHGPNEPGRTCRHRTGPTCTEQSSICTRLGDRREQAIQHLPGVAVGTALGHARSEETTSELQALMRTSYAGFCLQKTQTEMT